MIKSKLLMKNSGLPAEEVEYKPYPVPEEDTITASDDDFAEIKYMACYLLLFLS
jgi:hypothetical protein